MCLNATCFASTLLFNSAYTTTLHPACLDALAAARPLGPYLLLSSVPKSTGSEETFQPCTTRHSTAQEQTSHSLSSRETANLTFPLAGFIRVLLTSLLLHFPSVVQFNLFSSSFIGIPGIPSTTLLAATVASLLLFSTQSLDISCDSSLFPYILVLLSFSQDFTMFNLPSISNLL